MSEWVSKLPKTDTLLIMENGRDWVIYSGVDRQKPNVH